jgi:hypothetical protein
MTCLTRGTELEAQSIVNHRGATPPSWWTRVTDIRFGVACFRMLAIASSQTLRRVELAGSRSSELRWSSTQTSTPVAASVASERPRASPRARPSAPRGFKPARSGGFKGSSQRPLTPTPRD